MRTIAVIASFATFALGAPSVPRLCYLTVIDGHWQVVERRLDGTARKVLTKSGFDKKDPVYHPDGKHVYFSGVNRGVFEVGLAGKPEKEIKASISGIRGIRFSRDGKRTLFYRARTDAMDQSEIWIGDPLFRENRRVVHRPGLQRYPDGNADFTLLLYLSGQSATGHDIWLYRSADSSHRQITKDPVVEGPPRISPSGKWGAFPSSPTGKYSLYLVDLETGASQLLIGGSEVVLEMDWINDKELLCVTMPEGKEPIPAIADIEAKTIQPLPWKEENGFRSPSIYRP